MSEEERPQVHDQQPEHQRGWVTDLVIGGGLVVADKIYDAVHDHITNRPEPPAGDPTPPPTAMPESPPYE